MAKKKAINKPEKPVNGDVVKFPPAWPEINKQGDPDPYPLLMLTYLMENFASNMRQLSELVGHDLPEKYGKVLEKFDSSAHEFEEKMSELFESDKHVMCGKQAPQDEWDSHLAMGKVDG